MLNEANMPYSNCMRCANCDGFPCIVHAKSDAEVLGIRPALEHDNVELLIDAEVVRLDTDSAGTTVTGCDGQPRRTEEELTADFVVVACGAANSARLLLMSANDRHPNGLANGSDQVGRNYMFHNSQAVLALSMEENPTVFQKTLGLNDFYLSGPDFEFPMGNIQMVGKSQAPMFRGEKPGETKFAPNWSLDDVAKHAVDFWLSTEDLPRPDNRVTIDDRGTITIAYEATNDVPKQRLFDQLKSMVGHLGMHHHHLLPHHAYLKNEIPVAGVAHQAGTCRFGTDPASSVARRQLQGARARQPVRRRHEHLPQHRGGQPGADRDGQRAAGRRSPAGADGRQHRRRPTGGRGGRGRRGPAERRRVPASGAGWRRVAPGGAGAMRLARTTARARRRRRRFGGFRGCSGYRAPNARKAHERPLTAEGAARASLTGRVRPGPPSRPHRPRPERRPN